MKKLILIFGLVFLFTVDEFSQQIWLSQQANTTNDLNSIQFLTVNLGWIVGENNTLLKTTNKGNLWNSITTGISASYRELFFIDSTIGFVSGLQGTFPNTSSIIIKTSNGGSNWTQIYDEDSIVISSIHFVDNNNGWFVGTKGKTYPDYYGVILKTLDGGNNWEYQYTGEPASQFESIQFVDQSIGWVVGRDGIILKTTNGGANWIIQNYDPNIWLTKISFVNANIGWAVGGMGAYGIALKTINGGLNWITQIDNAPSWFQSVSFSDSNTGYAVGQAQIIKTNDGGQQWYNISNNVQQFWFYDTKFISKSTGWVIGRNGTILFTQSGGEIPVFNYFPLNIGNSWYFSQGTDNIIKLKIVSEADTVLSDGFNYTKFCKYQVWNNSLLQTFYLRESGDSVIQYPNYVILKYNLLPGDTVISINGSHYPAVFDGVYYSNIFGRTLPTFGFSTTPFDFYSYTDSIGFQTLHATTWHNWVPEYLLGCVIDGVTYGNTVVEVETFNPSPQVFSLMQNYPNPFNPSTKISWQSPVGSWQTLKVYDFLGDEVAALVNEYRPAGSYEINFQSSVGGRHLANGVYFYRLHAGDFVETKKMILLK